MSRLPGEGAVQRKTSGLLKRVAGQSHLKHTINPAFLYEHARLWHHNFNQQFARQRIFNQSKYSGFWDESAFCPASCRRLFSAQAPAGMLIQLQEIDKIIERFSDAERAELARHYIVLSRERLHDPMPIGKLKICLLKSNLRYVPPDERVRYCDDVMATKMLQTRALVLDLIEMNYTLEKRCIYRPERWIEAIVADINDTFELSASEADAQLFEMYNSKLCDEIQAIFCSCERFNSAGNQLLLNIIAYKDRIGEYTRYNFNALIKRLASRFNEGKCMELKKIGAVYEEYKANAQKKK